MAIKLVQFLIPLGTPYWILYIIGFLNFTLIGIFIIECVDIYLLIHWYQKDTLNWIKILDLLVYTAILTHLFLPRGVYKYYFTFHVPLIVLWICFHFGKSLETYLSKEKKTLFLFIIISLVILLIHRYIYLLIIWMIFFIMLRKNVQLNRKISVNNSKD